MKKIYDSDSRNVYREKESCEVVELLKTIKGMCDNCPERVFCEVAYSLKSCYGGEQSDR